MNQFGQSNTNDLQKAIDEITNGSTSDEQQAGDAAAELEDKIKGQMGVPPVPPTSGEGVPEMQIPGVAAPAADAGVMPQEPAAGVADGSSAPVEQAPVESAPVGSAPAEVAPQAGLVADNTSGGVAVASDGGAVSPVGGAVPEMGGDLAKVRESALQELVPLMDKVEISTLEKFNIYAEVIETTRDKSIVEKAFEAARSISDEKQKAESLLKLVKMIDTL